MCPRFAALPTKPRTTLAGTRERAPRCVERADLPVLWLPAGRSARVALSRVWAALCTAPTRSAAGHLAVPGHPTPRCVLDYRGRLRALHVESTCVEPVCPQKLGLPRRVGIPGSRRRDCGPERHPAADPDLGVSPVHAHARLCSGRTGLRSVRVRLCAQFRQQSLRMLILSAPSAPL